MRYQNLNLSAPLCGLTLFFNDIELKKIIQLTVTPVQDTF